LRIIRVESAPVVLSSDGALRASEYIGFSVVVTHQGRDRQESGRCGTEAMTSPIRSKRTLSLRGTTLLSLLCGCLVSSGQSPIQNPPPIVIDAGTPATNPEPARYDEGSARSPSGEVIGLNSRFLTMNGKPWLPVMGEFHFSRYPASRWEEEILKMKSAGVNIIATYVIWIHHEEIEGQFDWSARPARVRKTLRQTQHVPGGANRPLGAR